MSPTHDAEHERHGHDVIVHVNTRPVQLRGPIATGLEIKQAAIAQDVKIQIDFVLSLEEGHAKPRIIGDTDPVSITNESKFTAVAPDDNS